jgi:predicted transcriptional regulator
LIEKEQAQKGAVTDFLSKVLDGAVGPIVHFLIEEKKISKKEREELIRMLRQNKGDRHD